MSRILIIEDEAPLREEIADWLNFEGHTVLTADNGRLGLEAAIREEPDLIVCDIAMPELDGHAVLLEVRSTPKLTTTPFIFLTASAEYESMRLSMNLGADDYLTKPFRRADLLQAIHSRLRKFDEQQAVIKAQLDTVNQALAQEQEKRLLKSRLVAMFSHDFRTPLASILASTELLRNYEDRLSLDRKQTHYDRISGSVRLMIQMLDDMLAVAEMEHGRFQYAPQPLDITTFVQELIADFCLIYGEHYQFQLEGSISGPVTSDPKLIRQALSNLLSNAVKYSPEGSTVTVRLSEAAGSIVIEVADQGIGISEEDQQRLFEPFFRAENSLDQQGTGLGLTIARESVMLCSGSIHVTSAVDVGSTFVIRLPIHP